MAYRPQGLGAPAFFGSNRRVQICLGKPEKHGAREECQATEARKRPSAFPNVPGAFLINEPVHTRFLRLRRSASLSCNHFGLGCVTKKTQTKNKPKRETHTHTPTKKNKPKNKPKKHTHTHTPKKTTKQNTVNTARGGFFWRPCGASLGRPMAWATQAAKASFCRVSRGERAIWGKAWLCLGLLTRSPCRQHVSYMVPFQHQNRGRTKEPFL